jgi:predicted homoserine dehydrogenase-like protein
VTVGLIGAGKFGTMFLAQARLTRGMHVVAVADLDVGRAKSALASAGWPLAALSAASLADAHKRGSTHITPDAAAMIAFPDIEVIVEATGIPSAGIGHSLAAIANGKHIVMVNVEADAVAGPLLARKAKAAGVVYSLAWGDKPALICEHVDWARACGFRVVAAGKGTRYEPHYHRSTPDSLWDILDKYLSIADRSSINPKMSHSFIDGTKSAIEMTAVCNATGLVPQSEGLGFPPASRFELADVCKPRSAGGMLEKAGVTEVVSSVFRDGSDVPHHLALGTYVVIEGETDYARRCFKEYAMLPDTSGYYAALYRPIPAIGLSSAYRLRRAACGRGNRRAHWFRDGSPLKTCAQERRDTRWRRRLPRLGQAGARRALAGSRALPLGLAHNAPPRDVAEGERLSWQDIRCDQNESVKMRREMETAFGGLLQAG